MISTGLFRVASPRCELFILLQVAAAQALASVRGSIIDPYAEERCSQMASIRSKWRRSNELPEYSRLGTLS